MSDLPERLLCTDGNCIGTLNERGYCIACGKSSDGKHDPLRVEQGVDAKNHSALTEFQLECERLLAERLAQAGSCISNRTVGFMESSMGFMESFLSLSIPWIDIQSLLKIQDRLIILAFHTKLNSPLVVEICIP